MESAFDDTRILSYTDAEIIKYITSLPSLANFSNIIPLSSSYLAKGYPQDELDDAVTAAESASKLGIHVPRIQRIVKIKRDSYCIMERIHGTPLDVEWPNLGWIASIRLGLQLRRIIRRLRMVESSSAGSLVSGKCRSYYLDDTFGLPTHANPNQVNAFMNFWANFITLRLEIKKTKAEHDTCPREIFTSNRPFVFTHHDLSPRNMLLDRQGQLWLIDWDYAGFYPKFFEYAGMHNFITAGWNKFAIWRWRLFTWISSGFYGEEARWLEIIRSRFTRFRPGRRFNMKANGYAAAAGRPDKE